MPDAGPSAVEPASALQTAGSADCSLGHPPLRAATFLARVNRFAALVEVDGRPALAHVANSGRLGELLVAGRATRLVAAEGAGRRTAYDLRLVEAPGGWVCVDARVPNRLAAHALALGVVPELAGWQVARAEASWGRGRFDFLLASGERRGLLEVKSVTLVEGGRADGGLPALGLARFPDAPTLRGARHLADLAAAAAGGYAAFVWFLVLRADAAGFAPNDATDPAFGAALRRAVEAGVRVLAHRCEVGLEGIRLREALPVVV